MVTRKRTVEYFNREEQAKRALKRYGSGYAVRQHPKWKTWDVVKVSKSKPTKKASVGFPRLAFRF